MQNHEQDPVKVKELQETYKLKKRQAKVRSDYNFLKDVSVKFFQAEYVKAQAEEICRYLNDIQLTPLNPWYSKLQELVCSGPFMSQFYLTYNENGVVEPDYEKIKTLILPDPQPEDYPRSSLGMI